MVVAALFWSIGGVLGKSTHASGVVLSFWRMWIASAVLLVIVAVTKRWPSRLDFRRAGLAGVLFGLNICVFFIAIQSVSIAVALIISALAPVVALPVSVMLFGERPTTIKVLCAAASVVGVVVGRNRRSIHRIRYLELHDRVPVVGARSGVLGGLPPGVEGCAPARRDGSLHVRRVG